MDLRKIIDSRTVKEMAVATFYYASGAIFGPLLFLGGLGYFLDQHFLTGPLFLIIGVFLAFVTTNILLFKKLGRINKLVKEYSPEIKKGAEKIEFSKEGVLSANNDKKE
ncbi:MAG: hypothetical protein WC146_02800 [Patescibacteria group bacterium]|jgi:F0F1-type ATP synthase assembly protein I